jgi:hypothetical protein
VRAKGRSLGESKKEKGKKTFEHAGWSERRQWGTASPIVFVSVVSTRPGTPRRQLVAFGRSHSARLDMSDVLETAQTLYFGYGSNVWIDQMNRRCPESRYVGTAVLQDW